MKIKHECRSCKAIWTAKVKENSCPNCPESEVTHTEIIDFRDQPQGGSAKRQACYSFNREGEEIIITGQSPKKGDVRKGVILQGLPYGNLQGGEFVVGEVEHRAHKGHMGHLFHWTAKCEVI